MTYGAVKRSGFQVAVFGITVASLLHPIPVASGEGPAPTGGVDSRTFPGAVLAAETSTRQHRCESVPRSTTDRPDKTRERQVHVVYLVPSDSRDDQLDADGSIECSVRAWNRWFKEQSEGLAWRMDTFRRRVNRGSREAIDVTFVRASRPGSELGNTQSIEEELTAAGLSSSNKKYLAYVAAGRQSLCGRASYPVVGEASVAAVYLHTPGCHHEDFGYPGNPRWLEGTALHELVHTEGVVPFGAPRGCIGIEGIPAHVCTNGLVYTEFLEMGLDPERVDLMFPFLVLPLSEQVLDRGRDDYFGHSLPISDLADSPFLTRG